MSIMNGKRYAAAGAAIRQLREAKDLTQEQLAAAIDRDQSYVSRIEAGDVAPGRETLIPLLRVLGPFDIGLWSTSEPADQDEPVEAVR